MKKLLAILLGAAMVLVIASVASAEFSIAGQIVFKYTYDVTAGTYGYELSTGDTRAELSLKGTYGPVTADAKLRFKGDGTFELRSGQAMYKVNDVLSLGPAWDKSGDFDWYESLVDPDLDFEYKNSDAWLKANIVAGDLKATAIWNLHDGATDKLGVGGTYNLDPFAIGAAVFYDVNAAVYKLVPGVKYNISSEWSVAGEVWYGTAAGTTYKNILPGTAKNLTSGDPVVSADTLVGVGTKYKDAAFDTWFGLFYDVDAADIAYYKAYGKYNITPTFAVYGSYTSEGYYVTAGPADVPEALMKVGADLKLDKDGKAVLNFEYANNEDAKYNNVAPALTPGTAHNDTFAVKLTVKF